MAKLIKTSLIKERLQQPDTEKDVYFALANILDAYDLTLTGTPYGYEMRVRLDYDSRERLATSKEIAKVNERLPSELRKIDKEKRPLTADVKAEWRSGFGYREKMSPKTRKLWDAYIRGPVKRKYHSETYGFEAMKNHADYIAWRMVKDDEVELAKKIQLKKKKPKRDSKGEVISTRKKFTKVQSKQLGQMLDYSKKNFEPILNAAFEGYAGSYKRMGGVYGTIADRNARFKEIVDMFRRAKKENDLMRGGK